MDLRMVVWFPGVSAVPAATGQAAVTYKHRVASPDQSPQPSSDSLPSPLDAIGSDTLSARHVRAALAGRHRADILEFRDGKVLREVTEQELPFGRSIRWCGGTCDFAGGVAVGFRAGRLQELKCPTHAPGAEPHRPALAQGAREPAQRLVWRVLRGEPGGARQHDLLDDVAPICILKRPAVALGHGLGLSRQVVEPWC